MKEVRERVSQQQPEPSEGGSQIPVAVLEQELEEIQQQAEGAERQADKLQEVGLRELKEAEFQQQPELSEEASQIPDAELEQELAEIQRQAEGAEHQADRLQEVEFQVRKGAEFQQQPEPTAEA